MSVGEEDTMSSKRDPESIVSPNVDERVDPSESSASFSLMISAKLRSRCRSSSSAFAARKLLALAALVGLICRRRKTEDQARFSDDSSLLVVVSLLARCFTASTLVRDPPVVCPDLIVSMAM